MLIKNNSKILKQNNNNVNNQNNRKNICKTK